MNEAISIWKWLASDEGEAVVSALPDSPSASQVSSLRKKMSSEQIGLAIELHRARVKAKRKYGALFAGELLGDQAGVEMASSMIASAYKAKRFFEQFGDGAKIADLCCGIGGDSFGLLKLGFHPVGIDQDPSRCLMYQHNTKMGCVEGDAIDDCPDDIDAFHLDPARRSVDGKRTLDLEDFQPGPEQWERLLAQHPTGAIKLNPGVNAYELPDGECEVLSEASGLTQAVLWTGELAGEHERRATKLEADGSWCSVAGEAWRPEESSPIGQCLGTLDPCLERADLVGVFLEERDETLVHPGTGLITGDQATAHPMVRWHQVLNVMNWSRKKVKACLRSHDSGIVEVRTRGGVINPDVEQKQLRGTGSDNEITVLIYRIDNRVQSIITRRFDAQKIPHRSKSVRDAKGVD